MKRVINMRKNIDEKTINAHKLLTAIFLCVLISATSIFPCIYATVLSSDKYEKVADLSTMNSYQEQLLDEINGSRYAGRVWSDKSVFDNKEVLNLRMENDGYTGTVTSTEDFLHVFSALGSSQKIDKLDNNGIDLSISFDLSASMNINDRIGDAVNALNNFTKRFMEQNKNNRIAITVFGRHPNVILPLGHYNLADGYENYFEVNYSTVRSGYEIDNFFELITTAVNTNTNTNIRNVVNNVYPDGNWNNISIGLLEEGKQIGPETNLMNGNFYAFEELANAELNSDVNHIPVMVTFTDGYSNVENFNGENPDATWYTSVKPEANGRWVGENGDMLGLLEDSKYKQDGSLNKSIRPYETGTGASHVIILQTLMNAAYEKAKIEKHYKGENNIFKSLIVFNVGVDIEFFYDLYGYDSYFDATVPVIDGILNPSQNFNENYDAASLGYGRFSPDGGTHPERTGTQKYAEYNKKITTAYETWQNWIKSDSSVPLRVAFASPDGMDEGDTYFAQLPEDSVVTKEDVIENINYLPSENFIRITSDDIEMTLDNILTQTHTVKDSFYPIAGLNDFGISDAITYMDPIGKYMEVKEGSITTVKGTSDMAMLLFGEMYKLDRYGIYDFNFNATLGGDGFIDGWYNDTGQRLSSGNENWENAKYRLSFDTAKQYIPNLEKEAKDGIFTVYKIVDEDIEKERENLSYKVADDNFTFKLSDISIWTEYIGDNVVNIDGIETDSQYDEALYVNIPVQALPVQMASITLDPNDNISSYKDNLNDKIASTPIRIFYSVGINSNVLTENGTDIDINKIDPDYLKEYSKDGKVEIFSNYFTNSFYDKYISDTVEKESRGDPVVAFSPGNSNRYYLYQKNLVLYKAAYRVQENGELQYIGNGLTYQSENFGGVFTGNTENNSPSQDAVNSVKEAFNSGKIKPGDTITLNGDVITYRNATSSDAFYYIPYDYYVPNEDGTGNYCQILVSRKGLEFGSGFDSEEVRAGDYLCWADISGNYSNTYDVRDEIPAVAQRRGKWVLATKIGGARIGDLHQNIREKVNNPTNTSDNYFLPTVGNTEKDTRDVSLNVYLGNNGVLRYRINAWKLPETGGNGIVFYLITGSVLMIIPRLFNIETKFQYQRKGKLR